MRRFYQTDWQGISFTDFYKVSSSQLAGSDFYNAFYQELFRRYSGYEELDAGWLRDKENVANWIAKSLPINARVLSIGCGLGYMECCLHRKHIEVHVQDYASNAFTWMRHELPDTCIHLVGEDDSAGIEPYDLIYLSGVAYAVEANDLISMLSSLKNQLQNGGRILVLPGAYLDESLPFTVKLKDCVKDIAKFILETFGLYHRGQFWGWQRTHLEYKRLLKRAGYSDIEAGFIDPNNRMHYWISGR